MTEQKHSFNVVALIIGLAVIAGAIIFVISLFGSTNAEPEAIVGSSSVEITGQYGETYDYSDISDISLQDTIPAIGAKKNGAGLGDVKKGDFEVEGMGICRLFIMSSEGPYIVMGTNKSCVIISFSDPEKTRELFNQLSAASE